MTDQMKNILIGLFVTSALAIAIGLVLFLKPTIGDGKKTLNVRFANIAGISVGTRVTFAGKPIGAVVQIQELPKARDHADEQGRIYLYQLTLKIDSSVDVYNSDEIAIKTTGLMGEKSISIFPKISPKDNPAHLVTDQIVYANSTDALENAFNQVSRVAHRLETTVSHLDKWFDENQKTIASAVQSFDGALSQVGTLLNTDGAQILHNFCQISNDIASGNGTIGRFIAGDDFYLRLASLMSKGETLMNDVNHYGILFQYNKQWQKTRTRRANFLKALDTPQEFRSYFEGEVDSMTTSIGRLSELIDRANTEDRSTILQSDAFRTHFAALLRQVQGLTDSLRLYNESLVTEREIK